MSSCLTRPTLTISVDLERDVLQAPVAGQRALEELTDRLLELFARFEMPATWAVADSAISAAPVLPSLGKGPIGRKRCARRRNFSVSRQTIVTHCAGTLRRAYCSPELRAYF